LRLHDHHLTGVDHIGRLMPLLDVRPKLDLVEGGPVIQYADVSWYVMAVTFLFTDTDSVVSSSGQHRHTPLLTIIRTCQEHHMRDARRRRLDRDHLRN
jgi:hypothetical protein